VQAVIGVWRHGAAAGRRTAGKRGRSLPAAAIAAGATQPRDDMAECALSVSSAPLVAGKQRQRGDSGREEGRLMSLNENVRGSDV
jgi:hypothetical protein